MSAATVPTAAVPRGLYLLLGPQDLPEAQWEARLPALLAAGPALLQLRSKADAAARRRQAERLLPLCAQAGVPLIINDDIALAARVGAAGVHLGQGDGAPARARAALGPDALIGRTCHAALALLRQAAREGADYASMGALYPSATKPAAPRASLPTLRAACATGTLPICAIGGIQARHLAQVQAAGARLAAVSGAVWQAPDPARALAALVRSWAHDSADPPL